MGEALEHTKGIEAHRPVSQHRTHHRLLPHPPGRQHVMQLGGRIHYPVADLSQALQLPPGQQ